MFFPGHLKHFLSVIPAKAGIQALRIIRGVAAFSIFRRDLFITPSPPFRGRGKGEGESTSGTLLLLGAMMICLFLVVMPALSAVPPDLEDRTREIATELRCVVCQNLSVADSPSEMAQQMRAVVREQLEAGKTPEQIKEFFVSKYGEWVLLKPKTTGFSALLWILPYAALVIGIVAALWFIRRWSKAKKMRSERAHPVVTAEAQDEFLTHDYDRPNLEDESQRAQLLRERGRLKDELAELEFDFQSGKLSEADYQTLKQEIEIKGAAVTQQLRALPAPAIKRSKEKPARAVESKGTPGNGRSRRWQLVAGGVFLLLFGLGLGVMLTQSIRPRASENDSMTGDFMTGTTPPSGEAREAIAEGKQAFCAAGFPQGHRCVQKSSRHRPEQPRSARLHGIHLDSGGSRRRRADGFR